ncbi:hypothetical protein [Savagea faecisuis]|uniref:Uncharacterized protein n=1 Tax=Savagea faecisuis TaxID=1274803 RepID=A0ABW3GX48_9BACL
MNTLLEFISRLLVVVTVVATILVGIFLYNESKKPSFEEEFDRLVKHVELSVSNSNYSEYKMKEILMSNTYNLTEEQASKVLFYSKVDYRKAAVNNANSLYLSGEKEEEIFEMLRDKESLYGGFQESDIYYLKENPYLWKTKE